MENPEFLKEKYNLHDSPEVESAAERTEARSRLRKASADHAGERVPEDPASRIQNYLDRFKEITDREDPDERERGLDALKRVLYRKFVIKPEEIPESFFENQRRIARELGHGDVEITDEMREQHAEVIIADQKSSLDTWVDYLSSPDATYPDWLKYYATRSVLSMGEYDKEKKQFTKRSKGTTKPFPDLNREALAYVLDAVEKKHTGEKSSLAVLEAEDKDKFEKLLQSENFSKLYAWAIEKVTPAEKDLLTVTEGQWVKYDKDSDHMPLVESLQGHGTGWCTAGESTAEKQLQGGDFYVYYSLDQSGKPAIPRAAIRMQENPSTSSGQAIAEVRGIAEQQNLDPFIGTIVQDKLKEFPDGKAYEKKVQDMKSLTAIDNKVKTLRQGSGATPGQELTKEDLRFLYEIDARIDGFGYDKDPRIEELLASRDIKEDLSNVLGVSKDKISLNKKEALCGGVEFHYGGLDLADLTSLENLALPKSIGGGLYLNSLESAETLVLPKSIGGDLFLCSLQSAKGLTLPKSIGGDIDLHRLQSAEGLSFPESIGGDIELSAIQSAEGLELPKSISGTLFLPGLKSGKGLKLPENFSGSLNLNGLKSAEGLKLPENVGGYLGLGGLKSAEGLKLPNSIGSILNLSDLESAEGLVLPHSIGGGLHVEKLNQDALRKQYPHLKIV